MRYIFALLLWSLSSLAFANTYSNCTVEDVLVHEVYQKMVIVTVSCTAPDAMASGANCSGAINQRAFAFDVSTVTGKPNLALVLMALASGNKISAATYGACPAGLPDTLLLYSIKAFKR